MITLWLAAGVVSGQAETPAQTGTGGGAIIRTYEARRRLSDDLDAALLAMRRPAERSKRKRALKVAEGALRDLVASIRTVPSDVVPLAARDLQAVIERGAEVERGTITFAEWRAIAAARIAQAKDEIEASRLMLEEEEAAMFMLMAA